MRLEKFSTFFGLKLVAYLIFSASEQLSITLQSINTTAQDGTIAVNVARSFYNRQRDPLVFQTFYHGVVKDADGKTEQPVLPRYRNLPKKVNDGSAEFRFPNVEEYYKHHYFELMESLLGELARRFDQRGLNLATQFERIIIDSCNGTACEIPQEIMDLYARDLDIERLKRQLSMLPDLIKTTPLGGMLIKKVTTVHTVCDILNTSEVIKNMFSEVHSFLLLFLTLPVTSATAERTFSVLRRLKTYLRSTMSQERLHNVMLPHVYKDVVDCLDLSDIAQKFCSSNERRSAFFGQF